MAQPLRFESGPTAPKPGTGRHALGVVARLDTTRRVSGDPGPRAADALRRLARELLHAGEERGEAGSGLVLRGLLLARAEALLESEPTLPIGSAELGWLADDLEEMLSAGLPDSIAALDRALRDAFALLATPSVPAPTEVDDARWRALRSEGSPLAEVMPALADLLADADQLGPYRRSALGLRVRLLDASTLAMRRPAWVPPDAHAAFVAALVDCCRDLTTPDRRAAAGDSLRRLARVGRIIELLDGLERSTAAQRLQSALVPFMAKGGVSAQLPPFERFLALAARAPRPGEERDLARPLRPAYPHLAAAARQSRAGLLEALPRALDPRAGATDPALLGPLDAHRRRLSDLDLLRRLSDHISEPPNRAGVEPRVRQEYQGVSQRLLAAANDLANPKLADAALHQLRELADGLVHFSKLADEAALLAALAADAPDHDAWHAATAGRAAAIAARINDSRAGFLDAWSDRRAVRSQDATDAAAALQALHGALPLMADLAALHTLSHSGDGLAIRPWAALSPEAVRFLAAQAMPLSEELSQLALQGAEGAPAAAEALRARQGAALLVGRLARMHDRRGGPSLRGVIDLLAHGPGAPPGEPDAAAIDEHADRIAVVCRYAEEAAHEHLAGNTELAAELLRFINAAATLVPAGALAAE